MSNSRPREICLGRLVGLVIWKSLMGVVLGPGVRVGRRSKAKQKFKNTVKWGDIDSWGETDRPENTLQGRNP